MYRSFLRPTALHPEASTFRFDCGALELVDLRCVDGDGELTWTTGRCNTATALNLPIPLIPPESQSPSKRPDWTIDDYVRRVRCNPCVLQHSRTSAVRTLHDRMSGKQSIPLWFEELAALRSVRRGPWGDGRYLKNCLTVVELGRDEYVLAHPVGSNNTALLMYQPNSTGVVREEIFQSPICQLDAPPKQSSSNSVKLACKTEQELLLVTTAPNAVSSRTTLTRTPVVDFSFNSNMDSELALVDSEGRVNLVDVEDGGSPIASITIGAEEPRALAWTDHPRQLIVADSSTLRLLDLRSGGERGSVWWTGVASESVECVRCVPDEETCVVVVTDRAVRIVDVRRTSSTLSSSLHTLLDRPKFVVCAGRMLFVAGRECCDVVACEFSWPRGGGPVGAGTPFRLHRPEESVLWLASHSPNTHTPRTLINRLRAPLRGLGLLPHHASDTAVPLILTDPGDLFYQCCHPAGLENTVYDETVMADSWSSLTRSSQMDFEEGWSSGVNRRDLSRTRGALQDEPPALSRDCPLCGANRVENADRSECCHVCRLSRGMAVRLVDQDGWAARTYDWIDPSCLDIITSTRAVQDLENAIVAFTATPPTP